MPPSNPPKLYLNEHLSPRLATQLRSYGFDVTSSHGARMLSSADDEQFDLAVSEQRAIVTFNFSDFVELHETYIADGKEHWRIILSTEERTGTLVHRLLRLLNSV
jgi:predicted nuclease of predicted toxin-antitoxin system